jgi:hypothetical protein
MRILSASPDDLHPVASRVAWSASYTPAWSLAETGGVRPRGFPAIDELLTSQTAIRPNRLLLASMAGFGFFAAVVSGLRAPSPGCCPCH